MVLISQLSKFLKTVKLHKTPINFMVCKPRLNKIVNKKLSAKRTQSGKIFSAFGY